MKRHTKISISFFSIAPASIAACCLGMQAPALPNATTNAAGGAAVPCGGSLELE